MEKYIKMESTQVCFKSFLNLKKVLKFDLQSSKTPFVSLVYFNSKLAKTTTMSISSSHLQATFSFKKPKTKKRINCNSHPIKTTK